MYTVDTPKSDQEVNSQLCEWPIYHLLPSDAGRLQNRQEMMTSLKKLLLRAFQGGGSREVDSLLCDWPIHCWLPPGCWCWRSTKQKQNDCVVKAPSWSSSRPTCAVAASNPNRSLYDSEWVGYKLRSWCANWAMRSFANKPASQIHPNKKKPIAQVRHFGSSNCFH